MGRGLPKKYAKMGFEKGWKEYRKTQRATAAKRKSPKPKAKPKKSSRKGGKGRVTRKGGNRILGSMGVKGLIIGSVLLTGAKYLVRRFAPQFGAYETGVGMVGAGVAAKAMNTSGKSLLAPGIVDVLSEFIVDMIQPGGVYTLPGFAGTGGYDF